MVMEHNQLKELAELIDLDIGYFVLGLIILDQETKQYILEASYDKKTDLITTYNLAVNIDGYSTEQAINTVRLFQSNITDHSINFFRSLDPFYRNVYLLISIDYCEQTVDEQKHDLIKENIELKIDNYFINQQLAIQELKYLSYLKEVKTIKEKLLPAAGHSIDGLDYATYYRPSIGGGGDYFDLLDLRAARRRAGHENPPLIWGVGVMDVSGHGPGAAVEVAMVDAILRTYQGEKDAGPAEAIAYVNKHFFTRQSRGGFCTGFVCNYDAEADLFSYTSAGHLPVLIKHKEGHVTILESESGIPIGVEKEYQWTTETTQLEQGDTIVVFTDGITEAVSLSGHQFGMERLITCLENSQAGSAEVLMSNFVETFHQHRSNSEEQDDQTLIMVTISS